LRLRPHADTGYTWSRALCAPGQNTAKRRSIKKVHETTTFLLGTLPNINRLKIFTDRLSNKPFLIWLLTIPPHVKYVATLRCNLSLIACFLTLTFRRVVRQHMPGVAGFLTTTLLPVALTRVQGWGGTSLVSRLSACLTEANWWRLIAE